MCAWGASRHMLEKFSEQAGLDFDNYIFHVGKMLRMELPDNKEEYLELRGLVSYNKHEWENALLKGVKVMYGSRVTRETFPFEKYDYVIDCTGLHRTLLPKSEDDFLIPAYEYLLENVHGIDEFYVIGYKGARGISGISRLTRSGATWEPATWRKNTMEWPSFSSNTRKPRW